ncbi:MAG: hypothetical protein ACXADO_04660 [Candidatus Thorarchaeota archaeon]|jgi:hypothetical protein
MANANWTNKWVLMLMAGIVIQVIAYSLIGILKLSDFAVHPFFFDVTLIAFASLAVQIGGFALIMSKTKDEDPAIYGQGRPFQHKLREEDEDPATRKPTFDD